MTAALQAGRVSAIVDAGGCNTDQIVLTKFSERDFETVSQNFIHIQWRSVSEVFDYLGAILRYNERGPRIESSTPSSCPSTTPSPTTPSQNPLDVNLRSPFQFLVCPDSSVQRVSIPNDNALSRPAILFATYQDIVGGLAVKHNGKIFIIPDQNPQYTGTDYTRTILTMVSSLVNYAAQPTVSTTAPLRLLPIP